MTSKKFHQKNNRIPTTEEQVFCTMLESHAAIMPLIEPQTGIILDDDQAAVNFSGYLKSKLCDMQIHVMNILPPEHMEAE
jgi:hypothetical protein